MLPIANTNVANWKLGIGIGNNGNISHRFVQPAKQAFSCTASGGFRVRRAVVPEGWRTSGARRTACRPSRCAATDANRRKAIDRDGGFRGRAQAHPILFLKISKSGIRVLSIQVLQDIPQSCTIAPSIK
jgi:hypothetical protein